MEYMDSAAALMPRLRLVRASFRRTIRHEANRLREGGPWQTS